MVATAFADLGFDVDLSPMFSTPAEVARQAIENDVHAIGISSLAAGHLTLIPELKAALSAESAEDIILFAGGVIPRKDYGALFDAGVAAIIFTDIDRDGVLKGLNLPATIALANAVSIPVIASGGLASMDDIEGLCQPEAAVLEGAMIIVAALVIFHEAWQALQNPRPLDAPVEGLLVNWLASVLNGFWCWVLISRGRTLRSPALVADGKHLLSDVISSVGVTFGVLLAIVTGWHVLDPLLAGLVALNILWSGWKVMSQSLSGLMDEAVPEETLSSIRAIISDKATGAIEAHDLRTRHAGPVTFIDFHLVVDGHTSVSDAHDICDRIEAAIMKQVPDARVTIHVEPENKAKHKGVIVV